MNDASHNGQPSDGDEAYYFNLRTGKVERGLASSWVERMGPYSSYEAASHALETAKERNQEWERADEEWESND